MLTLPPAPELFAISHTCASLRADTALSLRWEGIADEMRVPKVAIPCLRRLVSRACVWV